MGPDTPAGNGRLDRKHLAAVYAAGVASLLEPLPASRAMASEQRGGSSAPTPEAIVRASNDLTAAAQNALSGPDPLNIAGAEVQLLAGAVLDLMAAGHLAGLAPSTRAAVARAPEIDGIAELRAIIEAPEAYLLGSVAGRHFPTPVRALSRGPAAALEGAEGALADAVHAGLSDIRSNVVATGGHIVQGALLLDAALLREAIDLVGKDLTSRLRVNVAGAAAHVADLVLSANGKLLALIGADALAEVRRQLSWWLSQLREGTVFPNLMDRVLRTKATEDEIKKWLLAYSGPEAPVVAARAEVNQLAGRFSAKLQLVDKVAGGLALVKVIPIFMTPAGRIGVAAAYLALLAYVVGSGYDHVDSDRLALLDRVQGVRGISQRVLVAPPALLQV